MSTSIESLLTALTAEHNVNYVALSLNLKQAASFRYSVCLQWEGPSKSGIPCSLEHGATMQQALIAAVEDMHKKRGLVIQPQPDFADVHIVDDKQ